jgi:dihydrofolate reductase
MCKKSMRTGKTMASCTMSLDGCIAGPNDAGDRLFRWYASGDTAFPVADGARVCKIARASAELLQETRGTTGAIVTGRRDFGVSGAWDGKPPLDVPTFIVTHRIPQAWVKEGSPSRLPWTASQAPLHRPSKRQETSMAVSAVQPLRSSASRPACLAQVSGCSTGSDLIPLNWNVPG